MIKPKRNWQSKLVTDIRGMSIAGGGRVMSHGERAKIILEGANYATLFAYLWRRFGPPIHGWDDHKELVSYYLTTPVPGVCFGLSCSPCGMQYGVSYAISKAWVRRIERWECGEVDKWYRGLYRHCVNDGWAIWNEGQIRMLLHELVGFYKNRQYSDNSVRDASPAWQHRVRRLVREYIERAGECPCFRRVEWHVDGRLSWEAPPTPVEDMPRSPHRTIIAAMEAGIRDLLRPVFVRDTAINACGRVEDEDVRRSVNRSSRAGCGCSPDLIDQGDDWWDLAEIIRKRGVKAVLNQIK